jgi:hypothetical protein
MTKTHNQLLAEFFKARPGQWIDGKALERVAGGYAWRTRVSNLRRQPFGMVIENRIRRIESQVEGLTGPAARRVFRVSEYRYVPPAENFSVRFLHVEAEGPESVGAALEMLSAIGQGRLFDGN